MAVNPLRPKVIELYKTLYYSKNMESYYSHPRVTVAVAGLIYLGREYPSGATYFNTRLKAAFMKNRDVTDQEEIQKLIDRGNYIVKELEALYMLKKYRTLKRRYYDKNTQPGQTYPT